MKKIQHFVCTRFKTGLTGLLLLLTPALYAQNNILYVNQNVNGGNGNGDSWANALTSLSDALKYARLQHDADTNWLQNDSLLIFVAKGTYKPQYNAADGQYTTNGNRDNTFVMVKNVQLYGGFDPAAGIDSLNDTRIFGSSGTILSGDIGTVNDSMDNTYHVVVSAGVVGSALLNGFTIEGGNANATGSVTINSRLVMQYFGGGMYNAHSSPAIAYVTIKDNSAVNGGGGVFNYFLSAPVFRNVTVSGNLADIDGGGMYNYSLASPILTNVTVSGNLAGIAGGGMYNTNSSSPGINNSIIYGNKSSTYSGGDNVDNYSSAPVFRYSLIGGDSTWESSWGIDGSNNIITNISPFVEAFPGDFRLPALSPAVNVGDSALYVSAGGNLGNDKDLAGNPRVYAYGNHGKIDLGAYELQSPKINYDSIAFANDTVIYNGLPQSVTVGNLPGGIVATYIIRDSGNAVVNQAINTGRYTVTAILPIFGGNTDTTVALVITPAPLTITANGGQSKIYGHTDPTFTYSVSGYQNGDNATILSGALSRVAGENAGLYPLTQGNLTAGDNYDIHFNTGDFEIVKAGVNGITFDSESFTYDGTPKSLMINGTLPAGAFVSYANNEHIDAGVYSVTANIEGGQNYRDTTLTAVLTITPAMQTITFSPLDTLTLETASDFQLQAGCSSALPVYYTFAYVDASPAATVSDSGWVMPQHSGMITITAHQDGSNNYLPADTVNQVLFIESKDATIHSISVNGRDYEQPGDTIYYKEECGDFADSIDVVLHTEYNAQVSPSRHFLIATPQAGVYKTELSITSQNGENAEHYVLVVERPFAFRDIVVQKFDNTLLVNNNPETNGGYHFAKYDWYRDDILAGQGQVYSAGNNINDLLGNGEKYRVVLTTDEGDVIHTCPGTITYSHRFELRVYPNPVHTGNLLNVVFDYPDSVFHDVRAQLYTISGQLLYTTTLNTKASLIHLPANLSAGAYLLKVYINGETKTVKINVQ